MFVNIAFRCGTLHDVVDKEVKVMSGTQLQMLLDRKRVLDIERAQIERSLREQLGLPCGWYIDQSASAADVTLLGSDDGDEIAIHIRASNGGDDRFFIIDSDGDEGQRVDPEAVRAALRVYDLRVTARRDNIKNRM